MLKKLPNILFVLLLPILIIALPFLLIAALYEGFIIKPKRLKLLIPELKKNWIPNQKYIYLEYSTYVPQYRANGNSTLIEFIEKNIIPKYNNYLVISNFPDKKNDIAEFNKVSSIISEEYISDYDGYLEAALVTIDHDLNFKTYTHSFSYKYDPNEVENTKLLFIEKIEECLKDWQGS